MTSQKRIQIIMQQLHNLLSSAVIFAEGLDLQMLFPHSQSFINLYLFAIVGLCWMKFGLDICTTM